jgi:hypothetical protein
VGLANFFSVPVDFSSLAGLSSCAVGVRFEGATTADQVQVGFFDFAPVAESLNAQTINATTINLPGGSTGGTPTGCAQSPVTGINGGYTCPTKGNETTLTANQGSNDATAQVTTTSGFSSAGCFFVDGEYECYTMIVDGTHFGGLSRGAYITTAATHNSGATVVGVSLVLGSPQQPPSTVIAYGSSEAQMFAVNNGFPFNHGGASVFSVNNGGNELWVDTAGAIHQQNGGSVNTLNGQLVVGGSFPFHPDITDSGYLIQANVPGTALQPQALAGGHAGSLNVNAVANIGAPVLGGALPSGASSASWECTGLDVDGNTIPGATTTVTSVAASWTYPQGISVGCPWSAGVVTYSIWRTAGGSTQGLLGTGTSGAGNGYWISDFGTSGGGTPPASNTSNPHLSVAGTGTPCITMGAPGSTTQICTGTGAPTSTCGTQPVGSGSLWLRTDGGASTSVYSCAGTTWTGVTIP